MTEQHLAASRTQSVAVRFLWLQPEDCPVLLSAALLGVSLHTSSSGRDLPMKALDMLGSGAPVLSRRFACVDELIRGERTQQHIWRAICCCAV